MRKFIWILVISILRVGPLEAQIDSLPSNLLVNTTIRIEGFKDTITHGIKKWNTSTGTGFFFMFRIDTTQFECIVTNKHVVENCSYGRLKFKVLDKSEHIFARISKTLDIANFSQQWIFHPDEDLAILPLKPILAQFQKKFQSEVRHVVFIQDLFPNPKDSLQISCIEKVLMIGYPKGLWDTVNNLPIVRQGLTATPFFANFNGRRRFLIDIPTFPGSSGSPVLLYSFDPYFTSTQWMNRDFRVFLLGIVVESYNYDALGSLVTARREPIENDSLQLGKKYQTSTTIPFNLAIVIKSDRLNDFVPLIKNYLESTKRLSK